MSFIDFQHHSEPLNADIDDKSFETVVRKMDW